MEEPKTHLTCKLSSISLDAENLSATHLVPFNTHGAFISQKTQIQTEKHKPGKHVECTEYPSKAKQVDGLLIENNEENAFPVPQIKINANGDIVVHEQSLVFEPVQTKRKRKESEVTNEHLEENYTVPNKRTYVRNWSKEDTQFFYKVLNTMGSDFSLMETMFPGRTRKQLKAKFKREEKINPSLIDKAMTQPAEYNLSTLYDLKRQQAQKEMKKTLKAKPWVPYPVSYHPTHASLMNVKKVVNKPKEISNTEAKSGSFSTSIKNFSKRIPTTAHTGGEKPGSSKNLLEFSNLQSGSVIVVINQVPTGEWSSEAFEVTSANSKVPIALTSSLLNKIQQSLPRSQMENTTNTVNENATAAVGSTLQFKCE